MPAILPALNLVAAPLQGRATLELAREIERRGFAGISVSSSYGNMAQCTALALATERITFATAIAPIYAQTVEEFAHGAPISTKCPAAVSSSASASRTGRAMSAWG